MSDLSKAYFSILNSCRVVSRSRFFFSLSDKPNPPEDEFIQFVQVVLSMGGESSANILQSALLRTAMDPDVMEIDILDRFVQDECDVYIDDVLNLDGHVNLDDKELGDLARILCLHIGQKRAWQSRGFSLPEGFASSFGVFRASNDEKGRPDVMTEAMDILEQGLSGTNILDKEQLKEIDAGTRKLPEDEPYDASNHFITRDAEYCMTGFLGIPWNCLKDLVGHKQNLKPRAVKKRGQRVGESITKVSEVREMLTKAPLTRRQKASLDMGAFDPNGIYMNSGVNTRYKDINTRVIRTFADDDKVMGWDDVIPPEFVEELVPVVQDSILLCDVWEPRFNLAAKSEYKKYSPVVVAIADASDKMTGSGVWLCQIPKEDYEEFAKEARKEGGLTDVIQNLKRPVPDMPEQKTYGEDCAACDQEEELYKETGKLPNDWNRPHSGHTHTLDGKRSSRMGKWVQEVAANTQQRATHLEGCEEILGTNFKELLPRLGPGTVNRVQLLATRQKVCQARSHASVQFLEFSAQDLNARISRHYQSLCEQFFGVPHPIWIMSDSKVALSLMNSPLQGFGFRTNILHRLLSIQAVTSRRDTLLSLIHI